MMLKIGALSRLYLLIRQVTRPLYKYHKRLMLRTIRFQNAMCCQPMGYE
ncbi:hypothetical protein Pan258_27020 [Symmachiella dynata]|nr:hypothetical protein Pan258_27020 [Symmachiella dynata]